MKTFPTMSACASALLLALSLLAPVPASAQQARTKVATGYLILTAANTYQGIRVTVGHPTFVAPSDPADVGVAPAIYLRLEGVDGTVEHAIEPGGAYTYTIDPRTAGRLVDPKTGLRHVPVHFEIVAEVADGEKAPTPAITIELVSVRTGEVQSFHAFPGFTGGVSVAAGDVN